MHFHPHEAPECTLSPKSYVCITYFEKHRSSGVRDLGEHELGLERGDLPSPDDELRETGALRVLVAILDHLAVRGCNCKFSQL